MSNIIFSSKDLFHSREYYEKKRPKFLGFSILYLLLSFIIATISIFIFELEDVVKGEVTIRPSSNISSIKSKVNGYVIEKAYSTGSFIEKGDILFKIDSIIIQEKLNEATKLLNEKIEKKNKLEILVKALLENDLNPFNKEIDSFYYMKYLAYRNEMDRALCEIKKKDLELNIEENKPSGYKLETNIDRLNLEVELSKLGLESWISKSILAYCQEIDILKQEIISYEANNKILEKEVMESVILSPISGNVIEIRELNVNDFISINEEILRIIPTEQDYLKVRIEIPADQVAELNNEMKIKIRFNSLPPSDYGFVPGSITAIPRDAYFHEDNALFFLVEGKIKNYAVHRKKGVKIYLRPGMVGEGRVIKKKKPIAEFISGVLDWT